MDIFSSSNAKLRNGRPDLNGFHGNTSNNVLVPASENSTTTPALTSINKTNNSLTNRSNVTGISKVESSSVSKKVVIDDFEISDSEPTLISRSKSNAEKNDNAASGELSDSSFEDLQEDKSSKNLSENLINLEDIPKTEENLMLIASIKKNDREFVSESLKRKDYQEFLFEITKSVTPKILGKLANDKNAQFTDTDINRLIKNYPFVTSDSSFREGMTFTSWGVDVLKKLVRHPELRGLRIVNNLPPVFVKLNEDYHVCNSNGLKLLHSLLARESLSTLTVDFNYKNWTPPFVDISNIDTKSFDLLKEIQARADTCTSVKFGEINLSRNPNFHKNFDHFRNSKLLENIKDFESKFAKMMCHVGLSHSVHTISLSGLRLSDEQVKSVLDKILECEKSSLKHLDLSFNNIDESAATSLRNLLESNNTCLETLKLDVGLHWPAFEIIYKGLKDNSSLKKVEISILTPLSEDHPIRSDPRVTIWDRFSN